MKKLFSLFMALILIFGLLAGCGSNNDTSSAGYVDQNSESSIKQTTILSSRG